ncbi:pentapeptide repeat-containing protein [Sphaerospermopsis aphanizomenoides BCCUSP55]|uniref:pentapeptide repeat-containing protein n=1 Tax=Sphaerospermopsis aphanizomenoides TaxID=459663 RepID=UPI000AFE85BD|nr:pentapeptide repeat-containing protein [Sphaerospermopsis aphanizomenoides]MBK1988761.1 pentapeptide repeat-containing protein [Sphaerospermopsis aphanizomenoides BCCUSP55]
MSAKKTDATLHWLITIIVIAALSLILIVFASTNIEKLSLQQRIADKNQALTTIAIVFLGLAVTVNVYYAAKRIQVMQKNAITAEKTLEIGIENTKLTQERLVAERFIGSIAQLGHEKVETRIGAIYALERIAQDFPQEHWTIMEILTAFVRENAPIQLERKPQKPEDFMAIDFAKNRDRLRRQQSADYSLPLESFKLRTDIQAALTVIGRRNFQQDRENQKLNLRNTDIRRVNLAGAKLQRVDLRGSDLCGADLREVDLSEAELDGAKLIGSILYEANLFKASLRGVNLSRANLNLANLYGVNLRSANLFGASLRSANLQAANLYKANLQQATLKAANLSGAKLFLANLQGAKLGKTNLRSAGLIAANLQGANLNGANLQGANLNAAKLQQTDIYFANLSEASLTEADLDHANLMGANLCQATLDEADLSWANLMGANLSGARLCDVRLTGAILTGAKNLESEQIVMALGDRTTRLPDYIEAPASWLQSV